MSPREFNLFFFFWQVNGKPIHLLDLSPWDKMHWNPLKTSKPCANREYLLGAYYMSDIVHILHKPYSWLSQQPFETVFISSFYWEGNWDLKRLSNLTNVLQVARGQPRFQLVYRARMSTLPTKEREGVCLQALRPSSEFFRDGQEMDYTVTFHWLSRL